MTGKCHVVCPAGMMGRGGPMMMGPGGPMMNPMARPGFPGEHRADSHAVALPFACASWLGWGEEKLRGI